MNPKLKAVLMALAIIATIRFVGVFIGFYIPFIAPYLVGDAFTVIGIYVVYRIWLQEQAHALYQSIRE